MEGRGDAESRRSQWAGLSTNNECIEFNRSERTASRQGDLRTRVAADLLYFEEKPQYFNSFNSSDIDLW